jgi:hypothetical protein
MRSTLDIRGGEAECPLRITEQIGINRAWTSATLRGHPLIAKTGAWRDGFRPALPMPPPAIPKVEQVGESIIADARNWMDQGEAKQRSEPDVARGSEPNGNRAIRAYEEATLRINGMQPTAHVLDPGAEAGEHIRLEIDVTELDHASPGCTDEPAVLPLDARVTDGALGVVPDCERRTHF